jgi:hypothetical protein
MDGLPLVVFHHSYCPGQQGFTIHIAQASRVSPFRLSNLDWFGFMVLMPLSTIFQGILYWISCTI